MIPIFLILFIIFLIIFNHAIKSDTRRRQEIEEAFWQRERDANSVRKQDISGLDFLELTSDLIPGSLQTDAEQKLLRLCGQKMLNLTSSSNTDLKMQYGVANLEELSSYEDTYVSMISALAVYTRELKEAGDLSGARRLLEFAVECKEDSFGIYEQLGAIYASSDDREALQKLLASAEDIQSVTGSGIRSYLLGLLEQQESG